ncbi:MAG: serine/threonine-protein kinase, partial [Planctomycetia bacterium]
PARTVYLLRQVCAALNEAHGLGLIHRDVKPANIYAARRGGVDDVVKLLDFGLVKQRGFADRLELEGNVFGSPPYMSPEQGLGRADVDARSDVYAVGAVTYFLLTGRPPFLGLTVREYVDAHARRPVAPPSQLVPSIPADLESIVLRCLEKDPNHRFQDVKALERALAACVCAAGWDAENAADWWAAHGPDAPPPAAATPRKSFHIESSAAAPTPTPSPPRNPRLATPSPDPATIRGRLDG